MAGIWNSYQMISDTNLVKDQTKILVTQFKDARPITVYYDAIDQSHEIYWSKYQIKESDRRQKTATFSSPNYFDLTTGKYWIFIISPYHDDFGGQILNVSYNEDTGMYDYQCQDGTRPYLSKFSFWSRSYTVYAVLRHLVSLGAVSLNPTQQQLEKYKDMISGLLPENAYEQAPYGSTIAFNPMKDIKKVWFKDKRVIDIIQDLVYGSGAYIDVYFDKFGLLHIEPYNRYEWLNSGLTLFPNELTKREMKFDITNVITSVSFSPSKMEAPDAAYSRDLLHLDLGLIFGPLMGSVNVQSTDTNSGSGGTTNTNTTVNNNGNPFGLSGKNVWINADNGSGDFKNDMANKLKNKGWNVHVGGTGPGYHYNDYFNVGSNYVYVTIYNGFCAGTIREAYSSKIQNTLRSKNVVLCVVFDTRTWTNPKGMAPYKYGDFTGYNAGRAWDDNFSSSDPSINNVMQWLKNNNAKWCASPTVDGVIEQFLAGGYLKYKGIQ